MGSPYNDKLTIDLTLSSTGSNNTESIDTFSSKSKPKFSKSNLQLHSSFRAMLLNSYTVLAHPKKKKKKKKKKITIDLTLSSTGSNNTESIDTFSSKSKSKFSKSNLQLHSSFRAMLLNSYTVLAHPKKSKKFRVNVIMEALRNNFESNWIHVKSHSSKLSYYHSIKKKFNREIYLDLVKGFSRRLSTTRLRISAHDYNIERGRYKNIPRENRICDWCKTSMGADLVQDEKHVLFSCDLYQKHRAKLLTNLNKAIKKLMRTANLDHSKPTQY